MIGKDVSVNLGDKWKELLNAHNGPEELSFDPVFSYPTFFKFQRKKKPAIASKGHFNSTTGR